MKHIKNLIATSLIFLGVNYCEETQKNHSLIPIHCSSVIENKDGIKTLSIKFKYNLDDSEFRSLEHVSQNGICNLLPEEVCEACIKEVCDVSFEEIDDMVKNTLSDLLHGKKLAMSFDVEKNFEDKLQDLVISYSNNDLKE